MAQSHGGRGFDRSYKRGAVMGLTVAEAFILLSFCLLLLFSWWQVDTEKRSLLAAERIAKLTPDEKAAIVAGLSDGTFELASALRAAGLDATDPAAVQDYVRLAREDDLRRLIDAAARVDPSMREDLAKAVEVTDPAALKAALADAGSGDWNRTFALLSALRDAGIPTDDAKVMQDLRDYARFMREEDFRRLMEAAVRLDPATRLSFAETVEATDEVTLRAALASVRTGDSAMATVAGKLAASAAAQRGMVALLNEKLGDEILKKGGSIDRRGTITLPQSVLFEGGADRVQDQAFLKDFCGTWVDALRQSGLTLSDLKIEGHASSEGRPGQEGVPAYLYNLDLSQRRARNALTICLSGVTDPQARDWTRERLAAIGYSSARLIYNPDGTENREASRRVMFSTSVNQDALIEDIKRDVSDQDIPMQATGPAPGESRLSSSRRPEIENHRSPTTKATTEPNGSRYVHDPLAQISKRDSPGPRPSDRRRYHRDQRNLLPYLGHRRAGNGPTLHK